MGRLQWAGYNGPTGGKLTTEFSLAVHGGSSARLVAVAADGTPLPFNSSGNCSGMYRGYVKPDGIVYTAIYDEAFRSDGDANL